MNPKNLAESKRGRLVNAPQGFLAFVPYPLPPDIKFDMDLIQSLSRAGAQARELHSLREQYRGQLRNKPNATGLLDDLLVNPCMTIAKAARVLNNTSPTAKTAIGALEEAGIVRETSGRQWGRVYVCAPVLAALERPFS